jgi:glycosyltransferase involved in cell wall biosynthesis
VDVTLLICTYNNARLLQRTLECVAQQQLQTVVAWEVLIVDNNCTDDTSAVVHGFRADARIPLLRFIREPQQGVAYARKRGLRESEAELIAFVDEDCLLAPDWVERVWEFARKHPQAGVIGGRNVLEFEQPPSELCVAYGESLARQELGAQPRRLDSDPRSVLCGAGLVLRRDALRNSGYLETGMLIGRDPVRLGAGEDAEIVLKIRRSGWEVWYAPDLQLRHVIPPSRTSLPYLCRLHHGFGRAEVYLQILARYDQPTCAHRLWGIGWAVRELWRVVARFPMGFVYYVNERPTWWIRWYYAWGCLEGAIRLLCFGRTS